VLACGTLAGSNDDGTAPPETGDAAADGAADAPFDGFSLSLDPPHITLDLGEETDVQIRITRAASFTDIVSFELSGAPLGVSTTIPAATADVTSAMHIALAQPALGDGAITIVGRGGAHENLVRLDLRIGSVITPDATTGQFVVPDFVTHGLDVKAWGAGGGGYTNAKGGVGGFTSARVQVKPGETLFAIAGAAGADCMIGGSGGGFSGLRRADGSWLLIAGGGGGGGGTATSPNYGGAGGGLAGGKGTGSTGGDGGSQTAGGLASSGGGAGGALAGGNASGVDGNVMDGGAPGGGRCGQHGSDADGPFMGGGGGGGAFGGGAGGTVYGEGSGGGGGSGYVADVGVDASFATGNSFFPPMTDDPDYADAGAAKPDFPGRIVVRIPKPY
jgi:hypothetical protein